MGFSFTSRTLTLAFTPILSHFFCVLLDENEKTESVSEDTHPDDSQPQTKDQPQQQQPEEGSGSSHVSGSGSLGKPEPPDLADRSSQSSFTSRDGTGKHE